MDVIAKHDPILKSDVPSILEAINKIEVVPALLNMVCEITGMGFSCIAHVTEERWIACAVKDDINFGLKPGGELKVETTICNEVRELHQTIIIDDVKTDPWYCNHPTPAMYGFQSYISVPIYVKDGSFFGTLCAIDPRPARLSNERVTGMFKLFTELISFHLSAVDELLESEKLLQAEKESSMLREQFIAILGHDLRNPVNAISNSAQFMLRFPLEEPMKKIATVIKNSSFRIIALIDNMLDFARVRMGGGVEVNKIENDNIADLLAHVISEITAIYPNRIIQQEFELLEPVTCDKNSLAQLLSNLIGNAVQHGKPDTPVRVIAKCRDSRFILSVCNEGEPIPQEKMDKLFLPFFRGGSTTGKQGLGLGLYIASGIAKAHGGTLTAISDEKETCFTLILPQ